jgi:hypothetical protein
MGGCLCTRSCGAIAAPEFWIIFKY